MKFDYGIDNHKIDITNIIFNNCLKDNIIFIPTNDVTRKNLFNIDPCPNKVKSIYINGYKFDNNTSITINIKKKICICFYGLTRSLKYTHSSIKNCILKILILNNYYVDIYLHTYDLNIINNKRSGELNVKLNLDEYKLLNPDYVSITSQSDFDNSININNFLSKGDPWPDNPNVSLLNLLRQLNSLKIVTKMHEEKDYNCYIYLRPDLKYLNNLNIKLIDNLKTDTFYTPNWGKFGGLNDRFGIGCKDVMIKFGYRIDKALEYSKINSLHSEKFLKYIMNNYEKNNIQLKAHRVRANGKISKDC
jgi:hypothetical protein